MEIQLNQKVLGDFGVHFREGNKGDRYAVRVSAPIKRGSESHFEVMVSGSKRLIQKPDGAGEWPLISVGDVSSSPSRPDLIPGVYVFEFQEDGTREIQVCGHNPTVLDDFRTKLVDVAAGASFTVPQGAAVGLYGDFDMDVVVPRSGMTRFLAKTRAVTFVARSRVLGALIWEP